MCRFRRDRKTARLQDCKTATEGSKTFPAPCALCPVPSCNILVGYLPPSLPINIGTSPRVKEKEDSANFGKEYKF